MSDPFDVIPFDDIKGDWKKLGSGSFGNVYKGSYLGIDVAIKEILPSSEYDVPKYFEREWRLLKESRHPNVVLYLGLSRAPDPDGRIFIISEFVEGGNVRQYIWDKSKPFSWRMRISFATDITRALAYLHARKCIHRDLKGENLLVTANGRLKITDFGFARIAARNEEESRRLTFCGTDAYMSPEILLGNEFDLPTDIFSLGVIFAEISARKLADDRHFKRTAPSFQIDPDEIRELASPGCPDGFAQLAIDCLVEDPLQRPGTREILERLRAIEAVVVAQPGGGEDVHTGSIRFTTGNRRPGAAPRIPSFGQGIGKDIRSSSTSDDESENELVQAVMGLENVTVEEGAESRIPLMQGDGQSGLTDYSTTVIRGHGSNMTSPPTLSSVLTVRASPNPASPTHTPDPITPADSSILEPTSSVMTIDSYYTAGAPSAMSIAAATEGGSTLRAVTPTPGPVQAVHRFTLIKPGTTKRTTSPPGTLSEASWGPLEFFTSGLLGGGAKCDICMKRLGRKLVLECDDCGLRAHLKCGEAAPLDCSTRAEISKLGRTFSPPVHAVSTPPIGVAAVKAKANGRATK